MSYSRPKRSQAVALLTAMMAMFLISESSANIVKRSFVRIGCYGEYDKSSFANLDRICEECHNMYREPGLHSACRRNCFTNEIFTGCLKALLHEDRHEEIKTMINKLYGPTQ